MSFFLSKIGFLVFDKRVISFQNDN